MTDLNDFIYTDNIHDVLAVYVNRILATTMRSEYKNDESLSTTRELADADTPIQNFDCNGANRIVKLPVADLDENHPFFIKNVTASGTYTLTLQNNGGTVNQAVLNPGEFVLVMPDGNGEFETVGKPFSRIVTPSQITANQNDYNPTGARSADVLRLSSNASRDITGLGFPAGGKIVMLINVGANNIVLKDESASSTAANRFALSADVTIAADQAVLCWYDATSSRWRVIGGSGGSSTSVVLSSDSPRVYTSGATWNKPAGLHHVIVEVVGGGGGGGGVASAAGQSACAMSGGGGEYAKGMILAASLGASETVTIGAGGNGGAAGNNNGSAGGNSSFGAHISANGGGAGDGGGSSATVPATGVSSGGAGGTGGSGGSIRIPGGTGIPGIRWSTTIVNGSIGGASHMSGMAKAVTAGTSDENGVSGQQYGGGGTGARSSDTTTNYAGGAGAAGVVIVWEYITG